jgi:DNA-binding response OmpR family regulator
MTQDKLVLVVDDDADLLAQTAMALESAGYKIITAVDSEDAEKKLESNAPDLILVDIVMEEVDAGLVFAERFGGQYPIIILSSIADSSDKVFDAGSLPIQGILQKPVAPADLIQRVKSALDA